MLGNYVLCNERNTERIDELVTRIEEKLRIHAKIIDHHDHNK